MQNRVEDKGGFAPSTVVCVPALARVGSGQRVMDVVAELVICLERTGVSRVDWLRYRKTHKVSASNLIPILNGLEEAGLLCRDVSRDGDLMRWDLVWVNPGVLRHPGSTPGYLLTDVKRFLAKRALWVHAKHPGGDYQDRSWALIAINQDCSYAAAHAHGRKVQP